MQATYLLCKTPFCNQRADVHLNTQLPHKQASEEAHKQNLLQQVRGVQLAMRPDQQSISVCAVGRVAAASS